MRLQVLNAEYLSILESTSGQCFTASGSTLKLDACANTPAQQFAYSGTATSGYTLKAFSTNTFINASSGLSASAATIEVLTLGDADRLAVVVDERPIGWATMAADVIIPDTTPPNGDEKKRAQAATTGGGSWEAAKAASFANVSWFKPSDFIGANRDTNIAALVKALSGTDPRIVLFEAGNYDFSLSMPKLENSCTAKCSSGATYIQVGGFCNCTTTACTTGGYKDATRSFDIGSNKSLIGLGGGAKLTNTMMRAIRSSNIILRNLSFSDLPGDVRQWDDALLFYPADHVWVDHTSFSGFGRGAVVLSGTRVDDGSSFYTYRDAGWMTFSWIHIDSSENWRCGGLEDSPYPLFTTNNPSLTFDHAVFYKGHGRNPAIDGEFAHFINSAWIDVTDGLDGRGNATLRVEGSYFDGKNPIRMDDPLPPTVFAPWDASLLTDKRQQNIFSSTAWPALQKEFGNRKLNISTLNTNIATKPNYPYSLDASPTDVLNTVNTGSGVGKIVFPSCSLTTSDKASYTCK